MNKAVLTGLVVVALVGQGARAAGPSLCMRLADEARKAPAAIWAQGDPVAAWIRPARPAKPSPTVKALANDARWHAQLSVPEGRPLPVQQLEGTPVYLIDDIAGSAACQSLVLVQAQPGQSTRQLTPPFDLDAMDLCTTRSARFAQVLGQPALVVGGAPGMTSPDLNFRIATWAGQGWGRPCSVSLRRGSAMSAGPRFCPPGSRVCEAGQPVALRLAQAYEAAREANRPLDALTFNGGRQPDAAVAAALSPPLAEPRAVGDMNPPFPLFGADERRLDPMQTVFSNADPRRLPVQVEGRWWLAVVGRAGVGWRQGDAVLVALFAPPGRAADGVASYQFQVGPTGLREVTAKDE